MRAMYYGSLVLVFMLGYIGVGLGQTGRASISGTVVDPSGAAVPNATVTATDEATGVTAGARTTSAGLYVLQNLIPGSYTVDVTCPGFETKEVAHIVLSVNQLATINLAMSVGQVSDKVEVTGQAPVLQTEDASVGIVISGRDTVDLPLNGRFYTQFLELAPGAVPDLRNHGGSSQPDLIGKGRNGSPLFNISGQEARYTNFWIDGISNNEHQFDSGSNIPFSIDAIQEFKLQDSNFSAEYGQSGVQVITVSKSGTNTLHGTLFEFFRNQCCGLEATQWVFSGPHQLQLLKRNQFGGNVGGPIKKDKLFFFAGYDGTREIISAPQTTTVPTQAMRNGTFPAGTPIIDWTTGLPFPNNTIPLSRFNSITSKVEKYWPVPNLPGTPFFTTGGLLAGTQNNLLWSPQRRQTIDQSNIRIDYDLSQRNTFFGRFTHSPNHIKGQGPLATNIGGSLVGSDISDQTSDNVGASWIHTFNPTSINEALFGLSTNPQSYFKGDTTDYPAQFGMTSLLMPGYSPGMPTFIVGSNRLSSGDYRPLVNSENDWQYVDNLTLARGKHNLRIGASYRRQTFAVAGCTVCDSNSIFSGVQTRDRRVVTYNGTTYDLGSTGTTYCPGGTDPTACTAGDPWADFLLGYPSRFEIGNNTPHYAKYENTFAFYTNDTWHVIPKLTLTLGLRYDLPGVETGDPASMAMPIVVNGQFKNEIAISDPGGRMTPLQPSILAAYPGLFTTCTAVGLPAKTCIFPQRDELQPRLGFAWAAIPQTVLRGGFGIYYGELNGNQVSDPGSLFFPFTQIVSTTRFTSAPTGNAPPPLDFSNPAGILAGSGAATPFADAFDPHIQHPVTYEYNLTVERQLNLNTDFSVGYIGSLSRHVEDLNQDCCYFDLPEPLGIVLAPGQNQVQGYPGLSFVQLSEASDSSNYNSLQARLQHRFSHSFSLDGSFTWSKAMWRVIGLSDPRNPDLDVSPTDSDIPLSVVVSSVWDLPVGKGKRFANVSGPLNQLIGGWRLGNIVTKYSGLPFNPTIPIDLLNQNGFTAEDRPDQICSGRLSHPTLQNWFNKNCFVPPVEPTTPGATLREGDAHHNDLRTPGSFGWDANLAKTFPLTERVGLEMRWEVFNVLNHPNHQLNPSASISPSGNNSPAMITGVTSLPRIIQIALKLHF